TLENVRALREAVEIEGGLGLSVLVAALTVAATLVIALPAAWAAARRRHVDRGLDGALVLARLFPTIALAIPLAALSIRLGLYNSPVGTGLWLAHTLLALPVAFLVLRGGFRSVPVELEEAARLDGASTAGAFWRVSLPLVRPSLAAASMLVFLVSWDEFGFSLLLQVTNRPLPRPRGVWQVDAAAPRRGARAAFGRHDPGRWPVHRAAGAARARRGDGLPELRSLPAHDGAGEHRVPAAYARCGTGGSPAACRGGGRPRGGRRAPRPPSGRAFRRPAPARRAGPGAGPPSGPLPPRRAAL